jgi:hypothetical protein
LKKWLTKSSKNSSSNFTNENNNSNSGKSDGETWSHIPVGIATGDTVLVPLPTGLTSSDTIPAL